MGKDAQLYKGASFFCSCQKDGHKKGLLLQAFRRFKMGLNQRPPD